MGKGAGAPLCSISSSLPLAQPGSFSPGGTAFLLGLYPQHECSIHLWHQWDLDQAWLCGHISVKLAGLHNPEPVLAWCHFQKDRQCLMWHAV